MGGVTCCPASATTCADAEFPEKKSLTKGRTKGKNIVVGGGGRPFQGEPDLEQDNYERGIGPEKR